MKYETGLMVVSLNCSAAPRFHPGDPSALTIPFDSRFDTDSPCFGTYVPYTLSNVRFSFTRNTTCLIGVVVTNDDPSTEVAGSDELVGVAEMSGGEVDASGVDRSVHATATIMRLVERRVMKGITLCIYISHNNVADSTATDLQYYLNKQKPIPSPITEMILR